MLFYSLKWVKNKIKCDRLNRTNVIITGLNEIGETIVIEKKYDAWIGVCTKDIVKVIKSIKYYFPGIIITYELFGQCKKVLPKFSERLKKNKINITTKYFYKLYSPNVFIDDIGILMNTYKFAYYKSDDWLTRLYIDLCHKNKCNNFFYNWYDVKNDSEMLLDSLSINTNYCEKPNLKIISFDLETVPLDGENRVPTGHEESDRIVMISIVQWIRQDFIQKILLYLNPVKFNLLSNEHFKNQLLTDTIYFEFSNEVDLLKKFHEIIQDCHILTGYNINNFDLPCLFARLIWLNMKQELNMYSSKKIGNYIVPTFQNKIVIDMYIFIQTFSKHNLPSFKLDVVAQCKLNKHKFPIKATSINNYYVFSDKLNLDILNSRDKKLSYDCLQPVNVSLSEFGTFLDCLEYCLEDSILVYELFLKEFSLSFLIERANVTAIDMEQALYFGNTRYILEVFKTFGTNIGYFINTAFFNNTVSEDTEKYKEFMIYKNGKLTFQGAINFCKSGSFFRNVSCLDFLSMYPSIILNQNLSYETTSLMFINDYLNIPNDIKNQCEAVAYQLHSENEIFIPDKFEHDQYKHPEVNINKDKLIMVSFKKDLGFIPQIVYVFSEKRKQIQKEYKQTNDSSLYTRQLNLKLMLNSIYGCMASNDSPLAYLDIAMSITCFARMYLLATSEFTNQILGYETAYCDTDGLFIVGYPFMNCDMINQYLNQKFMILQFEKIMDYVLFISKKRYIYEEGEGNYKMSGFEKNANELTKWMSRTIVSSVLNALKSGENDIGNGWLIWVNTLIEGYSMCSNPKTYCITRKTKPLHEYKSKVCPQLKIIKKNPSKAGGFIEYTYSQTDIALSESTKWIMEVDECEEVDFAKLFKSQNSILINLLNTTFFNLNEPDIPFNKILYTMRWKNFVNVEIASKKKYKNTIMILVLKSVNYTFELNDA